MMNADCIFRGRCSGAQGNPVCDTMKAYYYRNVSKEMFEHHTYGPIHYWEVARSYLGTQLYTTGFYLVDGFLVDCGPTNILESLKPLFRSLPVEKVLITHHHEDHTGNASYFSHDLKIALLAHPKAGAALEYVSRHIPFYRKMVWGRPKGVAFAEIPRVIEGKTVTLEVIETPGHSEDHLCLFERKNGWVFTGDLYLASYLRYLRDDEDVFEIMNSLRKLMALHPKVLFCNHRGPVENAEEALGKKLAFLERLRDQVQEANQRGIPLERLAAQNFKKDRFFQWFSAGEFSTMNLLRALARPNAK